MSNMPPADPTPGNNVRKFLEEAIAKDKEKILTCMTEFFADIGAVFTDIAITTEGINISEKSLTDSTNLKSSDVYTLSYQDLEYVYKALLNTILEDLVKYPNDYTLSTLITHPRDLFGKPPFEFIPDRMMYAVLLMSSEIIRDNYHIDIDFRTVESKTEVRVTLKKDYND